MSHQRAVDLGVIYVEQRDHLDIGTFVLVLESGWSTGDFRLDDRLFIDYMMPSGRGWLRVTWHPDDPTGLVPAERWDEIFGAEGCPSPPA